MSSHLRRLGSMKLDKINEINNLPSERLFSSLSKGISKETEDVTITAKKTDLKIEANI